MASHDISKLVDGSGDEFNFRDPTKRSIIQDVSKGANLVVNGNGVVGNNYNFSARTFIANTDLPEGNAGCFHAVANTIWHDEPISVNVEKKYEAEVWYRVKSANTSTVRFSVACFDIDDKEIQAIFSTYGVGTLTELTQDLKPGDTVVHLADLSGANWLSETNYHHGFIFWNYQNSLGYTYPPETYSRNVYPQNNVYLWDDSSAVNVANGTITLKAAWSGPTIPAGTKVSRRQSGGVYAYVKSTTSSGASTSWEKLSGTVQNMTNPGSTDGGFFRKGTAYIRIGFYNSNTTTNEYIEFTGLSLRELPDMISTARKLKTNLARTSDSTFDGSADQLNIPVTGTLPVGNGGTGKSSVTSGNYLVGNGTSAFTEKTPKTVGNNVLAALDEGSAAFSTDDAVIITGDSAAANTTTFYRRKVSYIWTWIQSKISSVLGLSTTGYTGNAATATKATQDGSGNTIDGTYKKHSTADNFTVPQVIDDNSRTEYQSLRIGNKFKRISVGITGAGNVNISEMTGRDNSPSDDKSIIYTLNGGTKYYFNGNAATASALEDDSGYVHITGSETITGAKEFSRSGQETNFTDSSGHDSIVRARTTTNSTLGSCQLDAYRDGGKFGVYARNVSGTEKWVASLDNGGVVNLGSSGDDVRIGGKKFVFDASQLGTESNTFYWV